MTSHASIVEYMLGSSEGLYKAVSMNYLRCILQALGLQ